MSPQPSAERDPSLKRRVAGYFVAALFVAAIVGGMVVVLTVDSGGPASPRSGGPFAPVYEGLEERREEAGVPTMAEGGGEHFHPEIEVYVRGERIDVPANIGIDPTQPPQMMAGLHTHDTSGTIHNEAGTGSTLGQFFAVWGVPFSATRLGPHRTRGEQEVRMWVDDEPSDAYGDFELADGQRIVVAFGTEAQVPPELRASEGGSG